MAAKSTSKKIKPKKETIAKVATPKKAGVNVSLYTASGEKSGTVSLSEDIFGQKPNKILVAQAVRVYLSNQRSAQAKAQRRGTVNRTKHKIYKQKGTGGARHGARSAPIYVGGGTAHGPTGGQNYKLNMSQNMRSLALISALSGKVASGDIVVADIERVEAKTKVIAAFLKKSEVRRPLTIVHAGSNDLYRAARNIENVTLIPVGNLTTYDVLSGRNIIITKDAIEKITSRFVGVKA